LEVQLENVRKGASVEGLEIQADLEALSARQLPTDATARLELSEAWKVAAKLVRETEGTTPFLAEALRLASELDPGDSDIAKAAAFEAVRQEKINARIDEANRIREALKGVDQ